MNEINRHFFSTISRLGQHAGLALLLIVGGGCTVTPPKVDPYSTLLPANRQVVDGTAQFSAATLKQETAYLVVGANFVAYADMWDKSQKHADEYWSIGIGYTKADLLEWQAQWSPARTTSLVATTLQRHFRDVVVVNDLVEAQAKSAKWIVMFDHAHVVPSTMVCAWTNSTSIDLLDGKFRRVAAVTVSLDKDYGVPLTFGGVGQCQRDRGEDVVRNVKAALGQFDAKLAAELATLKEQMAQIPRQQTATAAPPSSTPVSADTQGRRLALVIGNAGYKIGRLANPTNDADDISRTLKAAGFQVIDKRNATLPDMVNAVRDFGERLMSYDVGLVYYSGHALEAKGRNYLIPVEAEIRKEDEIEYTAFDANRILDKMDTAKKGVNILIVDACRDNPFSRSFRSASRGLAKMDAPQGTLVAFSTAPGKTASDGQGRNSPYTKNLLKALATPGLPIEQVFKQVRRGVQDETKGEQTPWESTSLTGDFYFVR